MFNRTVAESARCFLIKRNLPRSCWVRASKILGFVAYQKIVMPVKIVVYPKETKCLLIGYSDNTTVYLLQKQKKVGKFSLLETLGSTKSRSKRRTTG